MADKSSKTRFALQNDNRLYFSEIKQNQAPAFICSLISAKPCTDKSQFILIQKFKKSNP